MSTRETPESIESQRQTTQADHESQAFEQSDAAKVAAVAALAEEQEVNDGPKVYGHRQVAYMIRTALADPDAALARVRAEARAEAQAEIDGLRAERIAFTARLGFGDDHDSPAASLAEMIDPIEQAFTDASEFYEMPRICEGCGEWLASTQCEQCHGAGCLPNPQLAYLECDNCAGVGRVHVGCVQASYIDLVTQRNEARAEALRDAADAIQDDLNRNADHMTPSERKGMRDALSLVRTKDFPRTSGGSTEGEGNGSSTRVHVPGTDPDRGAEHRHTRGDGSGVSGQRADRGREGNGQVDRAVLAHDARPVALFDGSGQRAKAVTPNV